MESIGLFQLENLILARSPFLFFNLAAGDEREWPQPVARCLKVAEVVTAEEVKSRLSKVEKTRPVLLVSQPEAPSVTLARELEAAGFANVYIIAGGVEGLVSEL